ncbi:MAG: asparagine synthase (glutamine-hydrolyzing), partial [Phycisphaeraceae bacterium]|nr:asparagine synthase (glutamine-hydrolyzing) [Phycisphaeraceae bacterium]
MCGIAGIVRFDDRPIERERLEVMQGHLGHRGPDGRGIAELGRGALVHTRLSIIDLLSGDQPMAVDPGADRPTMTLVFNGEIYNHRELRHKLESRGHVFHSDHCDTEVLVHGYRAWGTELPKHLHGMYAFAIWDPDARELFLCRDRQGQKPLYIRWHEHAGGRELIFASLIATIMQACPPEERPTIDPVSMMTFLRFGYVTGDSLLKGLKEVPAGHWMKVDANGEATTGRYWQPPPISRTSTRIGVLDATLEVLGEAVEKRLSADVPLGCFLSGGIDSSVVASIAQKVREARGENPIHTFSIAIPEIGYDESHIAREVARAIGSDHAELTATVGDDVFTDLKRLMAISGEPTADSSLLPTLWLSRAARQQVKVALSGDGGDELFGGYDRYRAMRLLHRHRLIAAAVPTGLLPHGRPRSFSSRLRRLAEAARHRTPAAQYHQMIHLFTDEQIAELGALPENAPPPLRDWPDEPNPVSAAMRWDLVHYLPFDLLRKVDRASMSVAL